MISRLCTTSRTAKKNSQNLVPHKASATHHPNYEFSPLNYSLFGRLPVLNFIDFLFLKFRFWRYAQRGFRGHISSFLSWFGEEIFFLDLHDECPFQKCRVAFGLFCHLQKTCGPNLWQPDSGPSFWIRSLPKYSLFSSLKYTWLMI